MRNMQMQDHNDASHRGPGREEDNDSDGSADAVVTAFMTEAEDEEQEGMGTTRTTGLTMQRRPSEGSLEFDARVEGKRVIAAFLHEATCYDLVPQSSKVVVFDRNIPIRLSYYALVEHEIGSAPLWDPLSQKLSGIITTLDFIDMLRYGHRTNSVLEILDSHSVASWRSLVLQLFDDMSMSTSLIEAGMPGVEAARVAAEELHKRQKSEDFGAVTSYSQLVSIDPRSSLYESCYAFKTHKLHWLPVIDVKEQVCVGVLTHLAVLQYLVSEFCEDRQLFEQSIQSLGIGTLVSNGGELHTATLNTPVHEILDMLSENQISSVPIINRRGKPIAAYSRTNIIDLVSHNSIENSLDLALGRLLFGESYGENYMDGMPESTKSGQSIDSSASGVESLGLPSEFDTTTSSENELGIPSRMRIHTCSVNDTLQQIFVKFSEIRDHTLMYVDANGDLEGLVTLTDLFNYFVDGLEDGAPVPGNTEAGMDDHEEVSDDLLHLSSSHNGAAANPGGVMGGEAR